MKPIKIIFIILYGAGILFCVGLYLYNNFGGGNYEVLLNSKALMSTAAVLLIGMIKTLQRDFGKHSLGFYKRTYAEILKGVFEHNQKALKKLLKAIALYNSDAYDTSLALLNSLQPQCGTTAEKYAVNLFCALNYTDSDDIDKAIEIYESMILSGIADSTVFSNLTILYKDSGNIEKAEAVCKKAIALDSRNDNAYNNLAYAVFQKGDYDTAIQYAQKAVDINNKCLSAVQLLAVIYTLTDEREKADMYIKQAIANGVPKKDMQYTLDYYLGTD